MANEFAVYRFSPVTIITFIPAELHTLIAKGTLGLGGSIHVINPCKVSPVKGKFVSSKLKGYVSLYLLGS